MWGFVVAGFRYGLEGPGPAGVCEDAEVPDAVEAWREAMHQEGTKQDLNLAAPPSEKPSPTVSVDGIRISKIEDNPDQMQRRLLAFVPGSSTRDWFHAP